MNNKKLMPKLPKAAIRAFDDLNERFLRTDHFTADQMLSFADAAVKLNIEQGKRQPLTVVEIMREWSSAAGSVVNFSHAIEVAHGITATPQGKI